MLILVVTPEIPHENEPELIVNMLLCGVDRVHLRHPSLSVVEMRNIIDAIPFELRERLTVHDCFELVEEFPQLGINLNSRNTLVPDKPHGLMSRSCHSISEAMQPADYVLLSPIFPSISKPGYHSHFSEAELKGLPRGKVVALGGMTPERIASLKCYPFIGAAFSGFVWNKETEPAIVMRNVATILELK